MEQELQLWDDTRSQVIQFYLARVFRRGNQNKTKLLYHFRIGQIDPDTHTLKPVLEIINRESHLEDWDNFSRNIRDLILARTENISFSPREKDIAICMERILATPQIETKLTIDGVSYLLQTPEITGHMSLDIKFWTTVDLLKKFQIQLHQILQNRDFRSNVEILPELEITSLDEEEDEENAEEAEEQEEDDTDTSEVVKKAKPNTEMMIKVEGAVDSNGDSVEVEDWDEDDVDELGGEDNDTNVNDEKQEVEEDKQEDKPDEQVEVKEEKSNNSEDKETKTEDNSTNEEVEEKTEEKPKPKRRGRKPKTEKKEESDDEKSDEDKPKKRTRAKSTAKKTPAKKTTRKPRSTKKSDDDKSEDKPKTEETTDSSEKAEPKEEPKTE